MNQELLEAIKRRKQKLGVDDPEPEKLQPVKPEAKGHGENFNQNKKMLEELFGGKKNEPQVAVEVKKEEIKGDQEGFKNARAMLEKQFGKGPETNAMNINTGGSPGLLPPPPPLGLPSLPGTLNLPPPPPPPPSLDMLPPLPLPPMDLPPPPPFNLPPPPSFNPATLPPPPPPFNPINLPPPPPPFTPANLPPPPPPFNPQPLPPPPRNLPPPTPTINLPPPPSPTINYPPPPPPQNINLPPPQRSIHLPPPPPPPQRQDILPPPPPPPSFNNNNDSYKKPPAPVVNPVPYTPPPPPKQAEEDEACFILSGGSVKTNPSVPIVTEWNKEDLEKSKKKRIFQKKSEKKYPISEQLFGKNLGAFVKQQFLRTVNILGVIDTQVKKQVYEFHFPTIENRVRNIEPIETLYADTDTLDLVSCYMTKNLNAARAHNEQRDQFVSQLHSYNWEADPLKLKSIRESAAPFPNCHYVEPNFTQIKNSFNRIDTLMKNLAQQQEFNKCNDLKAIKTETEKMLQAYLTHPTTNAQLIERIDANVAMMKNMQL